MQDTKVTRFQGLKYDIYKGLEHYTKIRNHAVYPISMLVERYTHMIVILKLICENTKNDIKSKFVNVSLLALEDSLVLQESSSITPPSSLEAMMMWPNPTYWRV